MIDKFAYEPFFFASWKGNEDLISEISEAIIKIKIYQPEFEQSIITRFFSSMVNSPYNKTELDAIAKTQTYTLFFDDHTKPLAWYDEKTQKVSGILPDICRKIQEKTGLSFIFRPYSVKGIHTNEFSAYYYIFESHNDSYNMEKNKTESILKEDFYFYHKTDVPYSSDPNQIYTIAVPYNRVAISNFLRENYPSYIVKELSTPFECLEQLLSGKVDLIFLSSYVANNILISENVSDVSNIPTTKANFNIGLEFLGPSSKVIASVINKGYKLIDKQELSEIKLKHVSNIIPNATLQYFISTHYVEFMIIVSVLFILIVAAVTLSMYAKLISEKNKRILASEQARMEFFSRMSHDMRTPMNGILGMAHLSKNENDVDVLHHNINMVEQSGTYMLSLINDTLDFQKIESGKMVLNKAATETKIFFESVFDMFRITAEQKHIKFIVNDKNFNQSGYINIDSVRVKQIFSNLLSNAIKFTKEGGLVEFIAETVSTQNNVLHNKFQVCDNGMGISENFIKNGLFTPYAQEHNSTIKQDAGTGLGLAITKNLIELMGGKISVESELCEGSVFTVFLDFEIVDFDNVEKSLQENKGSVESFKEKLKGKRILLCEDHPLNAEIAKALLETVGCVVTWAKDGQKGIDEFISSPVNYFYAILMDIRMPVMDGIDATKAIRNLPRIDSKTIPIIAMTANAYAEDIKKCLDSGMNNHLAKPVDPTLLYKTFATI